MLYFFRLTLRLIRTGLHALQMAEITGDTSHAVWLYFRFCLSFRDVEEILLERGVVVTLSAYGPIAQQFRPRRYQLSAPAYRRERGDRFQSWQEITSPALAA